MTDAEKYTAEWNAIMAKVEDRELEHRRNGLAEIEQAIWHRENPDDSDENPF